jgi:hypothetical protein
LAALVGARDIAGIVERTSAVETTCPTTEGLPGNACEGQPTGTQVEGYRGGLLFGGVEFYGEDGFATFVAGRIEALGPGKLTLYTIASGGHITNARTCSGCASAVVSTPANAAIPGGVATLLIFEIEPVGGTLMVSAVLGGAVDDLARPAIEGGQYGHLLFERVEAPSPTPPAVGTGNGSTGAPIRSAVLAGMLAVAVAGLMVTFGLRGRARRP